MERAVNRWQRSKIVAGSHDRPVKVRCLEARQFHVRQSGLASKLPGFVLVGKECDGARARNPQLQLLE